MLNSNFLLLKYLFAKPLGILHGSNIKLCLIEFSFGTNTEAQFLAILYDKIALYLYLTTFLLFFKFIVIVFRNNIAYVVNNRIVLASVYMFVPLVHIIVLLLGLGLNMFKSIFDPFYMDDPNPPVHEWRQWTSAPPKPESEAWKAHVYNYWYSGMAYLWSRPTGNISVFDMLERGGVCIQNLHTGSCPHIRAGHPNPWTHLELPKALNAAAGRPLSVHELVAYRDARNRLVETDLGIRIKSYMDNNFKDERDR